MKRLAGILLSGLMLVGAVEANATPVQATGDVSVKYERDTAAGEPDQSGMIYTLKLMGEAGLGLPGWSLYARLGVQSLSRPWLEDFNREYYGADDKEVAAIDQFGVIYKDKTLTYKLGRQDAVVGTSALLYCRVDGVGKKTFVDGLSVAGTLGAAEISALLAREDNPAGTPKNKIYAVRTGFSPEENFNWGITLGRYDADEDGTNHWAIDGTVKFDRSSLTGEYTQSNSDTANQAYAIAWNYDADAKTSFSITNFRVEEHGDMGGNSDFDNGNRGWCYSLTHNLRDDASLEIEYSDQREINSGAKNTSLEASLTYSF